MSDGFRKQARLLADAQSEVQRAVQLFHQLKAERSAQAEKLLAEITAEADLQRRSLVQLSSVLEPGLLSAKLALISGEKSADKSADKTANKGADKGARGEERRAP
jgi:hypothetical protein